MLSEEDLTTMQVGNLRSHLGIVSQEPILFDTTIAGNIRYGDNKLNIKKFIVLSNYVKKNI